MRYEPDPGRSPAPADAPAAPLATPTGLGDTSDDVLKAQLTELLRVALEVLDGRRPPAQLATGFTERTLRYWRAAAGMHPRSATPSRLIRVVLRRPHARVAEVVAVVNVAGRHRALPARFDRGTDDAWRCTDVRLL